MIRAKTKPASDDGTVAEDLPKGWAFTLLGSLVTVNYGKGLKDSLRRPGHISVYGSNGVVGKHSKPLTSGPTIIIGRKGTIGAVHFSPQSCWPIDTTYFIDEFDSIDPAYLVYGLKTLGLEKHDTSTAIPGLNRDDLYAQQLPMAPRVEQDRIVEKIRELIKSVDASRDHLAKVPRILKAFRQSVLAAACSGGITADWRAQNRASCNFQSTTVGEIADYLGGFAYKSPTFLDHGRHQVVRIGNVRPAYLDLSASPVYIPSAIAHSTDRFKLQPADIVVSMTGTKYKRDYGFAAIVPLGPPLLYVNQRVARLRCKGEVLAPFLILWLQTDAFRNFFFEKETGNVNQGNVGADGIRSAPIELPTLPEQQEIVRRVETLFNLGDAIEKRLEAATKRTDKLTQAILAKAFRGELVPTEAELARKEGRDYEPASVLLKRIKEEREKTSTASNGFGRKHRGTKVGK
jgi:type I restriction enzyme S subunit